MSARKGRNLRQISLSIISLEDRVNPVHLQVVSQPGTQATPYDSHEFTTTPEADGLQWSGSVLATFSPDTTSQSNAIGAGHLSFSGSLVVAVVPDPGDVPGAPVHVHLNSSRNILWDTDPSAAPGDGIFGSDSIVFNAGVSGVGAWPVLTGGKYEAPSGGWSTSGNSRGDVADFDALIGGTFSVSLDASGRSSGVWVGGSGDFHGEIGASVNLGMTFDQPEASLSFSASYDEPDDDSSASPGLQPNTTAQPNTASPNVHLGPYLAGVKLDDLISVKSSGSGIAKIKLDIANMPGGTGNENHVTKTVKAGTSEADFKINPGLFQQGGSYQVTVTGLDAQGQTIATDTGTIDIVDHLALQLKASPVSDPSTVLDVDQLRLLAGEHVPLSVTATLPDLRLAKAYQDKLDIAFVDQSSKALVALKVPVFQGKKTTFLIDSNRFNDTLATGADYNFYVTPGERNAVANGNAGRYFNKDTPVGLTVLTPPDWLKKNMHGSDYTLFADPMLPGLNSAFVVPVEIPVFQKDFGKVSFASLPIFDGLDTSVDMHLSFKAVIPLNGSSQGILLRKQWSASAQVLGKSLLDKSGDLAIQNLHVDGNLAADTLDLTSLTITTDHFDLLKQYGIKTLFEKSFNKGWSIPVPAHLGPFTIDGNFNLAGDFRAEATKLETWASLTVDKNFNLVPGTSYIALKAEGEAELNVKAGVQVSAGILALTPVLKNILGVNFSVDLFDASVTGTGTADLKSLLKVGFKGNLFAPQFDGLTPDSYASLTVGYDVDYDVSVLSNKSESDPKPVEEGPGDETTIPLFGLNPAPQASGMASPAKVAGTPPGAAVSTPQAAPNGALLGDPAWTSIGPGAITPAGG
ncbi:hypothetical protein, partial [Zavarzinella formosa]|uniref:hypothetical protein n=1 Tax=Zavarzinella formosa TaxID=360055 RepID=UPI00187D91AF